MFATRCLAIAREKWEFTEENLRFLVEDNPFCSRRQKGIFFSKVWLRDFMGRELGLSMCLLMPQVENAIRVLASNCGAVVYKTDSNGVEEVLSLDSILQQPEIKESVEEKILFNVRVFYTGKKWVKDIVCFANTVHDENWLFWCSRQPGNQRYAKNRERNRQILWILYQISFLAGDVYPFTM